MTAVAIAQAEIPRPAWALAVRRRDVINAARSQIDVAYQHQASLKDIATDCIGLISIVASACDFPEAAEWERDAVRRGYAAQSDPETATKVEVNYLDPIPLYSALPGDVLRLRMGRLPHYAILSGIDSIIHAYASAGKVVENRIDRKWRARIVGAFRFKGL